MGLTPPLGSRLYLLDPTVDSRRQCWPNSVVVCVDHSKGDYDEKGYIAGH